MAETEGTSTIVITTRSGLREIYGPPLEVAVKCRLPKLDKHHRRFIARSPFICIATASRDGTPSVSPKGDAPGFVRVVDDNTLIIPDRAGNNQLATLSNQLDVDAITFETAANGGAEIRDIAAAIGKDKKVCIGVVNHRSLQVEAPEEVADLIRLALRFVEPERLIVSTDCGFGRQGMSRIHAFYKMVSIARGANIVRRELSLEETPVLAADPRFSFI